MTDPTFRDEAERLNHYAKELAGMIERATGKPEGWGMWADWLRGILMEPPIVDAPELPHDYDLGAIIDEWTTPPDFDAAVDILDITHSDFVLAFRSSTALRDDRTVAAERKWLAARQRVREVYEAVVRERDDWQHRAIGTEAKLVVAHLGLDALRAAQQGEVYRVDEYSRVYLHVERFHPGDKVRVCKIEEGA